MTTLRKQAELDELRSNQERQEAAIRREIRDLRALQRGLIDNPDRTPAQDAELNALADEIRLLQRLLAQLGAAYLENVAKLVDLKGLLAEMDQISVAMETEAKRMENATKAIATAGKIATLGTKVVARLNTAGAGQAKAA
jgi:hypothetical protein